MPRTPRPWFRKQTGWWMVILDGRQQKLAEGRQNKKAAIEKFHELMLVAAQSPLAADLNAASLCDAFLDWSKYNQSPETYRGYAWYLQSFAEHCGFLTVAEMRPHHVTTWLKQKAWNSTTRYNAVRCVVRAFNWGCQQGYLDNNPLKGMPRPRPRTRQRYMTWDEFKGLLRYAKRPVRLLLFAMWQTGARPCEIRQLTWPAVQNDRWVLREHKTQHKTGAPRVIYLTPPMVKLMRLLRRESTSAAVFTNCHGKAWTRNALRLQIQRLRKKAKLPADVSAYTIRHSFGTYGVMNGVDAMTVATLMGHASVEMVAKVYCHLAGQHSHLSAAVQKAVRPRPTDPHSR
jgi:integrase